MLVRLVVLVSLVLAAIASAGEKPPAWVEVHSGHFVVVSDAGEKQARTVADQLGGMRASSISIHPAERLGSLR